MAAHGSRQVQETELQELRAEMAPLRTPSCELRTLHERVEGATGPCSSQEATKSGPERPLKEPRRRAPRKKNREQRVPKDGLTLLEREEHALQRHEDLVGVSLARLLQLYTESSCQETRLDLRVLAVKFFMTGVTAKNGGSKVLDFQSDIRRLSASMALDPKEHMDLNAAFTKAAKERVRSCTGGRLLSG